MDAPRDYHAKWSQKEKDKYHTMSLLWSQKYDTNKLSMKQTHRPREQTCGCWVGGGTEGMDWEFGISKCKHTHTYTQTHTHTHTHTHTL